MPFTLGSGMAVLAALFRYYGTEGRGGRVGVQV
jgi:hypothetical protein